MKENSKPKYFTLSLIDNAIDSLEYCHTFLLNDTEYKWKWIGASLLHSLYLFCIELLEHGNNENVLTSNEDEDNERYVKKGDEKKWKRSRKIFRENSKGYTIKWDYIDGEPSFPEKSKSSTEDGKKLISFWTALARVQDNEVDGVHYTFSEPLRMNETQWKSVEWLYNVVNKIFYFVPSSLIIDEELFEENIKNTIPVIEFVANQSRHISFGEKSSRGDIEKLMTDIKNILDNNVINTQDKIKKNVVEETSVEDKNIIKLFTEGNNVQYLKKAKEFFYPDLNVEFLSLGGKNNLRAYFKELIKNETSLKEIVLFDCDAKKEFKDCDDNKTDTIIPLIIPYNDENNKIEIGIENLFNKELFESRFYDTKRKPKQDGGYHEHEDLNKKMFCDFICNERNDKDDFVNFIPVLKKIQEVINK